MYIVLKHFMELDFYTSHQEIEIKINVYRQILKCYGIIAEIKVIEL